MVINSAASANCIEYTARAFLDIQDLIRYAISLSSHVYVIERGVCTASIKDLRLEVYMFSHSTRSAIRIRHALRLEHTDLRRYDLTTSQAIDSAASAELVE